jgi:hypothetical protein
MEGLIGSSPAPTQYQVPLDELEFDEARDSDAIELETVHMKSPRTADRLELRL